LRAGSAGLAASRLYIVIALWTSNVIKLSRGGNWLKQVGERDRWLDGVTVSSDDVLQLLDVLATAAVRTSVGLC
jgi:hypothetical protein